MGISRQRRCFQIKICIFENQLMTIARVFLRNAKSLIRSEGEKRGQALRTLLIFNYQNENEWRKVNTANRMCPIQAHKRRKHEQAM